MSKQKHLYKATIKTSVYFLSSADNPVLLDRDATEYLEEDIQSNGVLTSCETLEIKPINSLSDVAEDWRNAIPWGPRGPKDKEITIKEWFEHREISCDGKVVEIDGKKYKLTEVK